VSLKVQGFININFFIMKKQFLNLGKALSKSEQNQIFGGAFCTEGQLTLGCVNVLSDGKQCLCPF
jgi:hypothetical protein